MRTLDELIAERVRSRGTDAYWLGYAISAIRAARDMALRGHLVAGYLTSTLDALTTEREIARRRAEAEEE